MNKNTDKKKRVNNGNNPTVRNKTDGVMEKPREIMPIMGQTSDPNGSYTGVPAGEPKEKPVQDADDL